MLCACSHLCYVSSSGIQSHLDWWPKIDTIYCYSGELRVMFADTQTRVVQSLSAHAPLRMTPVRHAVLHGLAHEFVMGYYKSTIHYIPNWMYILKFELRLAE